MKKLQITAMITIICFLITGCGDKSNDKEIEPTPPVVEDKTPDPNEEGNTKQPKTGENEQSDEQDGDDEILPVQPGPVQPEPVENREERLDYSIINELDNETKAWWLVLNDKHVTPYVPEERKKLISEYNTYYIGDTSKKEVYLTFDEGYENGYTPLILDTLKKNNVKAVFFITGQYIRENSNLIKRMLDEGHLVGNHTINHPSLPSMNNEEIINEICGLEKQFTEKFDKGLEYLRPPRGEFSERSLAITKQLGFKTIFWSFAYNDWNVDNQKGSEYACEMVMNNLHNGAVILLHAVSRDNAEGLDKIIKGIREKGYKIKLLDF